MTKILERWRREQEAALAELGSAHKAVGGTARGRRYATQQINDAYIVLVAALFQRFCRDLHGFAADELAGLVPDHMQTIVHYAFTHNRGLDRGNANESILANDFERLGVVKLWDRVNERLPTAWKHRAKLKQLLAWRNEIAHQSFVMKGSDKDGRRTLTYARRWADSTRVLANAIDQVVEAHLVSMRLVPST